MYLKSLEIQGFKSFPDKTVITFSSGITAIVGPNGSGKSNIVDAIRWVLGEQSTKTLRGAKMEDVVFGGTQRRKPQGFCEVTLTVENSGHTLPVEYEEVSITRRYYRSGESEFFINKKSVRLKDVHELLMDTGLGREGYSIIGQGRIDEILSVKSADRREIFEEAAGITKFRYRKEDALRKLAGTEENLVRIRDIITELEGQVEPLRVQAEQARQFLLLRDELRVLEVTVWLNSLEQLTHSRQKAQVDFDNAERMLSARRRELDELYAFSEGLSQEMREKDVETEQLRVELRNIEGEVARLQSDVAVLAAHMENNRNNASRLENELAEHESRADTLREQRQARLERLNQLEAQRRELEQESAGLEAQRAGIEEAFRAASDRVERLRGQLQQAEQQLHQLDLTAAALHSGVAEIENRSQGITGELTRSKGRMEEEEQKAENLRQQISQAEEREEAVQNMIRGFELRLKARLEKGQQLAARQEDARRNQAAVADRIQMLRSLEKEYEGFSRSVRQTLQAADKGALHGIHGPVSRLIQVEDEHSVAIEIALGGALSNIVTEDEESAKNAIRYLKSRDLGRATFLPLTAVRPRRTDGAPLRGQAGFIGMADELVRREERYDKVVMSLLGGTAVVDTIDSAIRISRLFSYKYRIVTLDGQLINPSGAMTGGSLNKNAGILSRANEIARLEQQKKEWDTKHTQLEEQLAEARRDYLNAENDDQAAREELRLAQNSLLSLRAEQSQHALLLASLQQAFDGLLTEQSTAGQRTEELRRRLADNEEQRQQTARGMEALQTEEQEAREDLERKQKARAGLLERQGAARNQAALLENESRAMAQGLHELEGLIESMSGDRSAKREAIVALGRENLSLQAQADHKQKVQDEYQKTAAQKQKALEGIAAEKMNVEARRVKADKEAQEKNGELLNMERERSRLETKKTQAEMEERQILDKMWESYELTRSTAQEIRTEVESVYAAQRRIGQLRGEIKRLGAVNISAIEEYAKVRQRYEFLDGQRKDLERAKGDLQEIIGELTRNMEEIFAREFIKINENFGVTFVELFGGGSASLELEDEGDILGCGIDINVELPGKSRRAISLLSGGEKALVAIVLYFAILKVRPTPFCVLDEIEAALDDVNVLRYVQYMRNLCGATQFILITHRRGTMEGSDILYGVTMQEQGVTKLLQLELNEVEKKINMTPN